MFAKSIHNFFAIEDSLERPQRCYWESNFAQKRHNLLHFDYAILVLLQILGHDFQESFHKQRLKIYVEADFVSTDQVMVQESIWATLVLRQILS